MITEQVYYTIWFFVGVSLLSVGVAYAWWSTVRVLWLRQDIYDMRDKLFMESVRLDCCNDAAVNVAREHLNVLARVAPVISIPLVIAANKAGIAEARELPKSENAKLDIFIRETMVDANARIVKYLMRETLAGWTMVILSRMVFTTWLLQAFYTWVQQWRESDAAENALRILENDIPKGRITI